MLGASEKCCPRPRVLQFTERVEVCRVHVTITVEIACPRTSPSPAVATRALKSTASTSIAVRVTGDGAKVTVVSVLARPGFGVPAASCATPATRLAITVPVESCR